MTLGKIVKLMLIRIGDEKRESIDAHLTVLCTKIVALLGEGDATQLAEATEVFNQVLQNMPHKAHLYACLMALLLRQEPMKGLQLLDTLLKNSLTACLEIDQRGF